MNIVAYAVLQGLAPPCLSNLFTLSLHLHHSAQPYAVLSQALEPNKSICLQSSRNHLSCYPSETLLAVLCSLLSPLGHASILERSSLITRSLAHPSTPPFFLRALSTLPSHQLSQCITVHLSVLSYLKPDPTIGLSIL